MELDTDLHGARLGDQVVELTRTEYQLLELLMLNPRRVLPHSLIYERVWGYDFGPSSNALRVYIGYLRRKLAELGAPDLIQNVRGVGYALRDTGRDTPEPNGGRVRTGGGRVVVAVAISVYVADRSELRGQIDKSLADVARPYESSSMARPATAVSAIARALGPPGGRLRPSSGDLRDTSSSSARTGPCCGPPPRRVHCRSTNVRVTSPPRARAATTRRPMSVACTCAC